MIFALLAGFTLFVCYGKVRGFRIGQLLRMAISGMATVKNIAIVMLLVGALTALWRACGTVAFIIDAASGILTPELFLPAVFLLCSAVSVLTGTSIGTAATMGVICMGVGRSMGIDGSICGGAILAGAYFGDRCSPVSTSAMLVAEITKTKLYDNIRGMIRTGWLAMGLAVTAYIVLGILMAPANMEIATEAVPELQEHYNLSLSTLLPAVAILVLAALRINVKITMTVSIVLSLVLCVLLQGITPTDVLKIAILGFEAPPEIHMMSGGGILGMLKMMVLVAVSLTYVGLFKGLGLMEHLYNLARRIASHLPPYGFMSLAAIATSALSCNQTLAIILTSEISDSVITDKKERALALENTAVVLAPIVPWTVASLIPLGTIGAPTTSILFACYLYLLPLVNIRRLKR